MNTRKAPNSRGFALVEVIMWIVIAATATGALAGAWSASQRRAADILWESSAKTAASSALSAAKATGSPACGASTARVTCSLPPGSLPTNLVSAGWSIEAFAEPATPIPSEGALAPSTLTRIRVTATDARGTQWVLDEIQETP